MFLASGPELVIACCKAGIVGTFPAKNQRTAVGLETWLEQITTSLTSHFGPDGRGDGRNYAGYSYHGRGV